MAERERIEDLGRIAEKINIELGSYLFEEAAEMPEEEFIKKYKNDDALISLLGQLEAAQYALNNIWHIARFGDDE